jgi:hypothetical protein
MPRSAARSRTAGAPALASGRSSHLSTAASRKPPNAIRPIRFREWATIPVGERLPTTDRRGSRAAGGHVGYFGAAGGGGGGFGGFGGGGAGSSWCGGLGGFGFGGGGEAGSWWCGGLGGLGGLGGGLGVGEWPGGCLRTGAAPRPCATGRPAGLRRWTATSTIPVGGSDSTVVVFTVMTWGAVTVTVRVTGGRAGRVVVSVSTRSTRSARWLPAPTPTNRPTARHASGVATTIVSRAGSTCT